MMKRRAAIALIGGGLASTSGCIGFLTGSESLKLEAKDVTVSDDSRSDAGYSEARDESFTNTQELSAAGQTREVKVTNHLAEYERAVEVPLVGKAQLARLSVISSPAVEFAGRTLNPLGSYSNRELAMQFQQEYETVSDVEHVGDRQVEIQGKSRKVSKFKARATIESGEEIDVFMHIAKYRDGEDFIVVVATHPRSTDGEEKDVDTLVSGIEHPA